MGERPSEEPHSQCRHNQTNGAQAHEWVITAAGVPGFIGFTVGRTDFKKSYFRRCVTASADI
jgi:hypothetical protein